MEQKLNNITEGVIWKQILRFFFPIYFGTFFQQLYNTADAVIVGKFVGKEALAAVGGTTGTLINLLIGFFIGLASGASVVISQYYGAGNFKGTQKAVHTAIALCLSGGVVLTVVGIIFAKPALIAMSTPEDVMDYALTYITVFFSGCVFNLIYNIGSGILRAVGDSKTPLIFLIVCTLTNIVLDLLFVVVFKLSVFGAGLATVMSQAVSAVLILIKLARTKDMYKLHPSKIRFDVPTLKSTVIIGIPAGLQSVMYSLSNVLIQSAINSFSTDTVAAWAAYGKIDGLFWMTINAFGISVLTFSGQNFGANKIDRIKKSIGITLLMSLGVTVILSTSILTFGKYIIRLFNDDPNVISISIEIMWSLVPFYFTFITIEIISDAIKGVGDAIVPTIITLFGVCGLRIVWLYTGVPLFNTIKAVTFSYPLTWTITSILFVIYYLNGGWLRRALKKRRVD